MKRRSLIPGWFALMIALSLAVIAAGLWKGSPPPAPEPAVEIMASQLVDRIWVDRLPEHDTDPFQAYMFSSDNVGMSAKFESSYKVLLEIFQFRDSNGQISFYFPHDRRKPTTGYKVEKMARPTRRLNIQLTLEADPQADGQRKVYYSGPELVPGAAGLPSPLHLLRLSPELTD
ncbi:MAG TPA: hypothetical protein VNO81_05030 [Candidatus Nitrosotenuis sp.]|nr:hypothetical protein [Candidatus Nitrosotenuis sp.]